MSESLLTKEEKDSSGVKKVSGYLSKNLDKLRVRNDTQCGLDEANYLKGQIHAIKRLIKLIQE